MMKEYCDNCKTDITQEEVIRVRVTITEKDRSHDWNYSDDALCKSCGKNFALHINSEEKREDSLWLRKVQLS